MLFSVCADPHPELVSDAEYDRRNLNRSSMVKVVNKISHDSWGDGSENYDLYQDKYWSVATVH